MIKDEPSYRLYTMAEIVPRYFERIKRKAKQVRIDRERKCYVIDGCYEIEFERCDTPIQILRWVRHLSVKTWFTTEMAEWFIDAACEENKIYQFDP